MQNEIWENIDKLRTDIAKITTFGDAEFNQYLIIQTLIELMDDTSINSLYSTGTLEQKRTNFLDSRFDLLKDFTDVNKYNYGLLRNYKASRDIQLATDIGVVGMGFDFGNGGISREFVDNFIGVRRFLKLSVDIVEDISSSNSNVNYFIVKPPAKVDISNFIFNNHNYIDKKNGNNEFYKLVGVLYDCPDGIGHQVTSVCFSCDCDLPNPKHIFMDDHQKVVMKLDNTFNKKNLQWGCKTHDIKVDILLYEKVSVKSMLQYNINQYKESIGQSKTFVAVGGGNIDYKNKYIKYKNKYLTLKNMYNL
jgi:hypothetical protein